MEKEKNVNMFLNGGADPSVFQFAKLLRSQCTEHEQILWNELRKKKLGIKFRRQHPYGKYVLDFYSHEIRLCIEIDGDSHNSKDQQDYDRCRTEELMRCGIVELRFSNDQVKDTLEVVLNMIKEEIATLTLAL